jgi:tetratricopeptide (TPR) repeat protein
MRASFFILVLFSALAGFGQKYVKSHIMGVKLFEEKRFEEAAKEFSYAISQKAGAESYYYRGRCYLYFGKNKEAKKDFDKAVELDNKKSDYHNLRGVAAENLGDSLSAISSYMSAISADSTNFKPYNNLARAYEARRNYKEALRFIERSIKHAPKDAENYFIKGSILEATGDTAMAISAYEYSLQLDSMYAGPAYVLSYLYNSKKDYTKAIKYAEKVMRIDPKNADAYNEKGRAEEALHDSLGALKSYNRAIELDPKNTFAYYNRGNLYSYLGMNLAAIYDFSKIITLDPNDADAFYSRAECFADTGNYASALSDLEMAKKLNPKDPDIYFQIGICQDETRFYREAIESYNTAIKLDSLNEGYYYSRGNTYYNLEDLDNAHKDYLKALQLDSTETAPYFNLGNIHFDKKEFELALPYYDKYLKNNPKDGDAYVNRGICLKELGKTREACVDWNKAATLNSNEAKENLKKFCK